MMIEDRVNFIDLMIVIIRLNFVITVTYQIVSLIVWFNPLLFTR